MEKRIFALLITVLVLFSLAACSEGNENETRTRRERSERPPMEQMYDYEFEVVEVLEREEPEEPDYVQREQPNRQQPAPPQDFLEPDSDIPYEPDSDIPYEPDGDIPYEPDEFIPDESEYTILKPVTRGNEVDFVIMQDGFNGGISGILVLELSGGLMLAQEPHFYNGFLAIYSPHKSSIIFAGFRFSKGDVLFTLSFIGRGTWTLTGVDEGDSSPFSQMESISGQIVSDSPPPPPVPSGKGRLISRGVWDLGAYDEVGSWANYWHAGEVVVGVQSTLALDIIRRATQVVLEFSEDAREFDHIYFITYPMSTYLWKMEDIHYRNSYAASYSEDGKTVTIDLYALIYWLDFYEDFGYSFGLGMEKRDYDTLVRATLYFTD
jgi:hypothetical protein